jgi:RNA polymerase sigma-70 factor (ECF subfamily)
MPLTLLVPRATPTPTELVEAARAGHAEALATLYTRHGADLLRLGYRLTGSAADAEDVLQDVFVGLPEALRRYEERGDLPAWLRRVTARTALMRRRRMSQRGEVPLDGSVAAPDVVGHAAEQMILQRVVDTLPEALRVVLVLKVMEGYSHAEIATMLGIRRGTSEVRLYRAIRRLRSALRNSR